MGEGPENTFEITELRLGHEQVPTDVGGDREHGIIRIMRIFSNQSASRVNILDDGISTALPFQVSIATTNRLTGDPCEDHEVGPT